MVAALKHPENEMAAIAAAAAATTAAGSQCVRNIFRGGKKCLDDDAVGSGDS